MDPNEFEAMMARATAAGEQAQADKRAAWIAKRDRLRKDAAAMLHNIGLTREQRSELAAWLDFRADFLDGQSYTGIRDAAEFLQTGADRD
ncbi:hypothetical protein AB0I28_12545 [Phytomonospora sp. NPDC050363]|uniref:hypothetical protein n=1 Tax=Phytomonospora sp. NPDC050363 TaxID=3155642 RepID=UPI0033CD5B00